VRRLTRADTKTRGMGDVTVIMRKLFLPPRDGDAIGRTLVQLVMQRAHDAIAAAHADYDPIPVYELPQSFPVLYVPLLFSFS
jgi:hypothetical protein